MRPLPLFLGAAVGLGLLAPGASMALEQMPALLPQQVRWILKSTPTAVCRSRLQ